MKALNTLQGRFGPHQVQGELNLDTLSSIKAPWKSRTYSPVASTYFVNRSKIYRRSAVHGFSGQENHNLPGAPVNKYFTKVKDPGLKTLDFTISDLFTKHSLDPLDSLTSLHKHYTDKYFLNTTSNTLDTETKQFLKNAQVANDLLKSGTNFLAEQGSLLLDFMSDKFISLSNGSLNLADGLYNWTSPGPDNSNPKRLRSYLYTLQNTSKNKITPLKDAIDFKIREVQERTKLKMNKDRANLGIEEINWTTLSEDKANMKFGTELVSFSLRQAKKGVLGFIGNPFESEVLAKNSLILDIETAGLNPNAPILQIGMVQADKISDTLENSIKTSASLMHPKDQLKQGFLAIDLVPEAIIRDTGAITPDGLSRTPSFKTRSYMPASLDEFYKMFGNWTEGRSYDPRSFYEAFGTNGTISSSQLIDIQERLARDGFVEATVGNITKRWYSQREGAKWSMVMVQEAARKNANLIAANLPFESQRIGKLWSYFIKDEGTGPFRFQSRSPLADGIHEAFLNQDADLLEALDRPLGPQGTRMPLSHLRDITSTFAASWKSPYKLNILDQNNYVFTSLASHLRMTNKMTDYIDLFPYFMNSITPGLRTRDQLDLNKMLLSGLMKTDFINSSSDLTTGIDIATQAHFIFGQQETHEAIDDAILQGKLLFKGKLLETVNLLFNVTQSSTRTSLGSHLKSLISGTRLLTSKEANRWFNYASIMQTAQVTLDSKTSHYDVLTLGDNIAPGSSEVTKTPVAWKKDMAMDRELLRLRETLDSIMNPNNANNIYSSADPTRIINYTDEAVGALPTNAIEPFSLSTEKAFVTQTFTDSEGNDLYIYKSKHDYKFEEEAAKEYTKQLKSIGESEGLGNLSTYNHQEIEQLLSLQNKTDRIQEAQKNTYDWALTRYAHTPHLKNQGITLTDLENRANQIREKLKGGSQVSLNDEERKFLTDSLTGKHSTAYQEAIINSAQAKAIQTKVNPPGDLVRDDWDKQAWNSLRTHFGWDEFKDSNQPGIINRARRAGSNVGTFFDNIASTEFNKFNVETIGNTVLKATTNINPEIIGWFMKSQKNNIKLFGGLGLAAGAIAADYSFDSPIDGNWKLRSKDILKKTGNEKEILPEGSYTFNNPNGLSRVTLPTGRPIDHTNELGIATSTLDSSRIDYAIGDGDTVEILSKGFFGFGRTKLGSVRLGGIDTPEVAHNGSGGGSGPGDMPYSQQPKQYLSNVLSARSGASIQISDRQTFGRHMGLVTDENGTNYTYQMIQEGLGSVLFRETSYDDLVSQKEYKRAELTARKSDTGMWNEPFYFEAQGGVNPRDRMGWNKLTDSNRFKFNLFPGPGSTDQQLEALLSSPLPESNISNEHEMPSYQSRNNIPNMPDLYAQSNIDNHERKQLMADAQITALMTSMSRNRGRGKARR